jgi:predicted RNA polymerase sigma factor
VLDRAVRLRRPGPYQLQAAIAAVHSEAAGAAGTDWRRIAALYEELARFDDSAVVRLNHAAAVAMCEGPERGLELIDAIEGLDDYAPREAARAELARRAGRRAEAAAGYERAIALAGNRREREFLERRVRDMG